MNEAKESAAAWLDPAALVPWDKNPRRNEHAVQAIADSIDRFGFATPIVARQADLRVIAGHTRLRAALQLGLDRVPVRLLDISDQEADALALADNRLGELADWDDEGLAQVLADLQAQAVDLDGLGWSTDDLDDLISDLDPYGDSDDSDDGDDPDQLPTAPPAVCQVGQSYPVGPHLLHCGDCLDVLRAIPSDSVDAVVTDPPYGLSAPPDIAVVLQAWLAGERYKHGQPGFMGSDWDSFVPGPAVWREVYRVLKPGAHAVVFAGDRTVDLMGISVRLAGFELRQSGVWCYYSGFPKSLDLSKEMDRLAGAEREVVGTRGLNSFSGEGHRGSQVPHTDFDRANQLTAPATPDAIRWQGFGTGIKPSIEPWLLLRKPISESSIARNVLRWGVGGLNIDACRFAPGDTMWPGPQDVDESAVQRQHTTPTVIGATKPGHTQPKYSAAGRFPANLIHCSKASRKERESGLDANNLHPTVKPYNLMRWLVALVSPTAGNTPPVVLDPFVGSGTTLLAVESVGGHGIGIELEPLHADIALARLRHAYAQRED